jgi:hypothetical protein
MIVEQLPVYVIDADHVTAPIGGHGLTRPSITGRRNHHEGSDVFSDVVCGKASLPLLNHSRRQSLA